MSEIFDAYDLPLEKLPALYQRLSQPVRYPDGMMLSLDTIYWGRPGHQAEIGQAIPLLLEQKLSRLSQLWQALRTPGRLKAVREKTGISEQVLRIMKHDIELWLLQAVSLRHMVSLVEIPPGWQALEGLGLADQLAVISAGRTPEQRTRLSQAASLPPEDVVRLVRLCDFYRTGRSLEYIRSKIYYAMGMNTWQKWALASSEEVIAGFEKFLKENPAIGERLVPFPKEVRSGIEWAKLHLEIYSVEW